MRFSTFFLVAFLLFSAFVLYRSDEEQTRNVSEAALILQQIEALHTPASSAYVDSWRVLHKTVTTDDLADLRIAIERIKADPQKAAQMVADSEQKVRELRKRRDAKEQEEAEFVKHPMRTMFGSPLTWTLMGTGLLVLLLYRLLFAR